MASSSSSPPFEPVAAFSVVSYVLLMVGLSSSRRVRGEEGWLRKRESERGLVRHARDSERTAWMLSGAAEARGRRQRRGALRRKSRGTPFEGSSAGPARRCPPSNRAPPAGLCAARRCSSAGMHAWLSRPEAPARPSSPCAGRDGPLSVGELMKILAGRRARSTPLSAG